MSIAERIAMLGLRLVDCGRCGCSVTTDITAGPVRCEECATDNSNG